MHLCKLTDSPWSFLTGSKDNSTSIPRTVLVRRVVKNPWLLESLSERALTVLRIGGIRKLSKDSSDVRAMVVQGVGKFLSFFTAILIEAAEQISFDETRLRHIYLYLIEGFKIHFNPSFNQHQTQCLADWKISCCLIVSQLSKKTRFGGPLCKNFSKSLAVALLDSKSGEMDYTRSTIANNVMVASCVLCQHGQLEITPKFLAAIYKGWDDAAEISSWLFDMIKQMEGYDTASLVNNIVWSTLKCLIREEKDADDAECGLSAVNLTTLLCRFIQQGLLTDQVAKDILFKVFSLVEKQTSFDETIVAEIRRLIKAFSSWLPSTFDSALKSVSSKGDINHVIEFLSGTFADASQYSVESVGDDSLYVSLCSPIRELRVQALKKYAARTILPDEDKKSTELVSLAEAALRSFADSDVLVASNVWHQNVVKKVLLSVSFSVFLAELEQTLDVWFTIGTNPDTDNKRNNLVLSQVFKCIASKDIIEYFVVEKKLEWLALQVVTFLGFAHIDVQADVVDLLKALKTHLPLFSEIDIKKGAFDLDRLSAGVAKVYKQKNNQNILIALKSLLTLARNALTVKSTINDMRVASVILFMVKTVNHDVRVEQSIAHETLQIVVDYAESSHSQVSTDVLKSLFTQGTSLLGTNEPKGLNIVNIWHLLLSDEYFSSEKVRLAKSVLSSSSPMRIDLIDLCLESLFPNTYVQFLLKLVLTEQHHLQVAAMSMLVSFIDSKSKNQDVDELTLVCGVVSLWASAHSDSMIRNLGLLLCSRLTDGLEHVHRMVALNIVQNGGASTISINTDVFQSIFRTLKEKTSVVQCHADGAIPILKQSCSGQEYDNIRKYLWAVLANVGWKSPAFSVVVLNIVDDSSLDTVWPFCLVFLSEARGKTSTHHVLLNSLVDFILTNFPKASKATQSKLIDFLASTIKEHESFDNQDIKQAVLSMLMRGMLRDVDPEEQNGLYELLMERQLSHPGDSATLDALAALNMRPQVPLKLIATEVARMSQLSTVARQDDDSMDDPIKEGFSVPLQRMVALLEAAVPTILRYNGVVEGDISVLVVELFSALHITNRAEMKSILSIEYYKAVILEALSQCFLMVDKNNFQVLSNLKSGSKSGTAGYTLDRTETDLIAVMECLGSLKSVQIQGPAFLILQSLIKLNSRLTLVAIKEIGDLLSSPSSSTIAGRDKFLTGILELLVGLMDIKDETHGNILQAIVQSLCVQLPVISSSHRLTLLRTALKVLQKEVHSSMIILNVLLIHTIAAYENENLSQIQNMVNVEEVCLSRSAQRRAKRVVSMSGPEEFYSLAKSLFLEWNSHDQVQVLSQILGSSLELLHFLGSSDDESSSENVVSSIKYLGSLIQDSSSKPLSNHDLRRGFAATFGFLQLEFVLDLMESKVFHRQQAKIFLTSSVQVQRLYLEVADAVLKLIASTESMRKTAANEGQRLFQIRFESENFRISLKALLDMIQDWSLETLHSLQRLLDGPSFISIMQELFGHELLAVRQRAVRVLKDRLQQMLIEKTTAADESVLYFDLSAKMRSLITQYLSQYASTNAKPDSEGRFSPAESALAQSSLMCLDVLIQYLGTSELWKNELLTIVKEFVEFIPALYLHCSPQHMKFTSSAKALDTKKLLGSLLLCSSTAFKMLHVAALPFFPKIMTCLSDIFKNEASVWKALKQEDATDGITDFRAHVLFARSVVSSQNLIVAALPSFIHPHLNQLLRMMLDSYVGFGYNGHVKELKGLSEDASTGLNIIATKIPPRLLIPALANCIDNCMGNGHAASRRMAQLVLQVSKAADRATTLSNMTKWMVICFEMMDYRRKYGDFTTDTDDVEEVICDSLVVLCLKLTESELKAFILKIVEWKSSSIVNLSKEIGEKMIFRRSRAFYVLIKTLVEKLKILFFPTMSLLWSGLLQDIELSKSKMLKIMDSQSAIDDQQIKKRKRENFSAVVTMTSEIEGGLREILNVARIILATVQILCDNSNSVNFVNQVSI